MLTHGHARVAVEGLEDHARHGALRLGRPGREIRLRQIGHQEWPAQEPERLGQARSDTEGGCNPQQHRGVTLAENPVHQQGERNEGHRRKGQHVPDGNQRRAAGCELGQDVGRGLAEDVGVFKELLQQSEADSKSERDDDQENPGSASDGENVHGGLPFVPGPTPRWHRVPAASERRRD